MENKHAGRRPGNEETREKILAAACTRFGDVGFEATTIRSVAAEAEVDPALVMHYFKNKQGLFDAVVSSLQELPGRLEDVADLKGYIAQYLQLWEAEDMGSRLKAVLRAGVGSSHASGVLRQYMDEQFLELVSQSKLSATVFDTPEKRERIPFIGAMLVGVAITRNVILVPYVREKTIDELAEIYAAACEAIMETRPQADNSTRWPHSNMVVPASVPLKPSNIARGEVGTIPVTCDTP